MASKEERRNEILKAAIKVISEFGFEGAKIEDIAKEAGIGKGTVYEYFESKNTLFIEMIRYSAKQFEEGLVKVLSEGDTMFAKVRNLSAYFAGYMSEHLDIMNSSLSGQTLPVDMRNEMMSNWAVIYKTIEDVVREGIRISELRANIDSEMATTTIIGGLKHYNIKKIFMDKVRAEDIDHEGIAKILLHGLAE